MELMGSEQSTFTDMVSELGLSASMRSDAEYTLLAPLNIAFSGESFTASFIMFWRVVDSWPLHNLSL